MCWKLGCNCCRNQQRKCNSFRWQIRLWKCKECIEFEMNTEFSKGSWIFWLSWYQGSRRGWRRIDVTHNQSFFVYFSEYECCLLLAFFHNLCINILFSEIKIQIEKTEKSTQLFQQSVLANLHCNSTWLLRCQLCFRHCLGLDRQGLVKP